MNATPATAVARRLMLAALVVFLLWGCVTRPEPLYFWGSYQGQVYGHFKGEKGPEEQIAALESEMERATAQGKALPPGFHAHLAMLYGKTGRSDKMAMYLEAEKRQFPESSTFMDFLLRKFEK